jgi:hypothetical protein
VILEIIMASRHEDIVTLWSEKDIPFDKELVSYNYKWWFDNDIPVNWVLKPITIKVSGSLAIIAYTYKFSGNKISGNGRIMETWIKKDNKWLILCIFSCGVT